MKDYYKKDICEGDTVVYAKAHGRNSGASLDSATVVGFTPTMVRLQGKRDYPILKSPEKMVVYNG